MIRLRTLGSVDLCAADGSHVQSVLRQPKRLAVLIYLAAAGPVFHRRDRLLALFWPESDEERARGALNQQVFQLRHALGKDIVVNRGDDELGLGAGTMDCDVCQFNEHIRAGRDAEAMALYGGELLPNFVIDDAPDFTQWLDEERTRVNAAAALACQRLSEEAELAADLATALEWARRAISIQPLSEPNHQRLMVLLDRSGDRAAALSAFEDLRALLRAEFEAEPSAETLELLRAIRERDEAQTNGWHSPVIRPVAPPALRPGGARARRAFTTAAVLAVALGATVWTALIVREPGEYRPPADRLAVLYFNDESAGRELGYLAEGLTSTLIDELGQVKQLQVISQNGVRPFRGNPVGLDSIARQLDVGTIVGGSVSRSRDRVRVTVELTDGATGLVVRSKQLERPVGELFALLDDVSNEVSAFLRVALGEEIRLRQRQAETRSQQAWELYQRAEVRRAYADSVEKTGGLGVAMAELERADSLLAAAARLDEEWPAPLVLRGRVAERRGWMSFMAERPRRHDYWFSLAGELADRAVDLDERNASAYEVRGSVGFATWMLATALGSSPDSLLGRAESDLQMALSLDPDLPRAESSLSGLLFVQGRYEEARRAARRALEADAYLTDANEIANRLFTASFEVGDDVEAGLWCDEVRRRQANQWPAAYCDLILLGWSSTGTPDPRKALLLLETAGSEDSPQMREAMRPRLMVLTAAVLARAGRQDSARAVLRRATSAAPHDIELLYLEAGVRLLLSEPDQALRLLREYWRVNPSAKARIVNGRMFRPLRSEPEFRAAAEANAVTGRQSRR